VKPIKNKKHSKHSLHPKHQGNYCTQPNVKDYELSNNNVGNVLQYGKVKA
jgi:hypothetical protein